MQRVALLSAFEKTDALAEFARKLRERQFDLLASAGTATFLAGHGIEAKDVAEMVGEPILGHRVVTLAREIYAGILARPEDDAELDRLHIRPIDLVFVDLYPLQAEIERDGSTEQTVIEKTDIGGPTLLRAAAKARRLVLTSVSDLDDVIDFLDREDSLGARERRQFRARLAAKAERLVSEYAAASASYCERVASGDVS